MTSSKTKEGRHRSFGRLARGKQRGRKFNFMTFQENALVVLEYLANNRNHRLETISEKTGVSRMSIRRMLSKDAWEERPAPPSIRCLLQAHTYDSKTCDWRMLPNGKIQKNFSRWARFLQCARILGYTVVRRPKSGRSAVNLIVTRTPLHASFTQGSLSDNENRIDVYICRTHGYFNPHEIKKPSRGGPVCPECGDDLVVEKDRSGG